MGFKGALATMWIMNHESRRYNYIINTSKIHRQRCFPLFGVVQAFWLALQRLLEQLRTVTPERARDT
jgi:hypothetical protein